VDVIAELLRRTPRFKGKGRLVSYWLRTRTGRRRRILPGGLEISLDMTVPYEAMIWIGWEEKAELEALARLLRPGDTFVDCGANIGLWSLVAAPLVGPDGNVIAFEPNPDTAMRLSAHAGQSPVIEVHRAALSDRPGSLSLALGNHHNVTRVSEHGEISVPAMTLDAALKRAANGIKIDVEGCELQVLMGAQEALSHRPWIVVEFNTDHTDALSLADWPVHRLLVGMGYRASTVEGQRLDGSWVPEFGFANLLYQCSS
jgi:FkbM family methyltransferase